MQDLQPVAKLESATAISNATPTPRTPRWINLCHRSYPLHGTPFLLLSKNRYPTGAVSSGSATNPWVGREREYTRDGGKRGWKEKRGKKRHRGGSRALSWMALRDIVSRSAEEGQRQLGREEGNRFEGGLEEEKEGWRGSEERWIIGSRDQREPPLRRCRPVPFSLNLS